ncbi:zinc-binding dehydrogenase, partial [Streptomyces sp. URMC 126]
VEDASRIASVADMAAAEIGGTYVFVRPDTADLTALGDLADAGKLTVPLDAVLPLAEAAEAFRRSREGRTRGKIVLEIPSS